MKNKKTLLLFLFIGILSCAVFITGCEKEKIVQEPEQTVSDVFALPQNDPKTVAEAKKTFYPLFDAFLKSQYEYVLKNTDKPVWGNYLVNKQDADKLKETLDKHLVSIEKYCIEYLSYTTAFSDNVYAPSPEYETKVTYKDGKWYFSYIMERYELPSNDGSDEGGGINYNFIVSKQNNVWMIESYALSAEMTRWAAYPDPETPIKCETSYSGPQKSALATTYNRSAAVTYATTYVFSPNTSVWCDYSSSGGDCTNFVSQCLYAGGWSKFNNGSFCSTGSWYHNGAGKCSNTSTTKNYSCSWTQAADMKSLLSVSSRVVPASYPASSLEVGDIIQLKNSSGTAYHTMIVTTAGSIPKVTYRNASGYSPQKNYSLSNFNGIGQIYWKLASSY